jgi:alkylhydroperoxidase/carboxymuconolactone decarboxylase family protein YurZ
MTTQQTEISAAARAHHETLFPGHQSTLAVTDPEFVALFDNSAFDEVVSQGVLDTPQRMRVILAALIAVGAIREYTVMLGAALTVGVTPLEAKEIVYHAVPYVGQGRVFDVLLATNDVLAARGVALPLPGQATSTPDTRLDAGLALRRQIFGADATDGAYAAAPAGQEPPVLVAAITQLVPWIGYPRSLNAVAVVNEVLPDPALPEAAGKANVYERRFESLDQTRHGTDRC